MSVFNIEIRNWGSFEVTLVQVHIRAAGDVKRRGGGGGGGGEGGGRSLPRSLLIKMIRLRLRNEVINHQFFLLLSISLPLN